MWEFVTGLNMAQEQGKNVWHDYEVSGRFLILFNRELTFRNPSRDVNSINILRPDQG